MRTLVIYKKVYSTNGTNNPHIRLKQLNFPHFFGMFMQQSDEKSNNYGYTKNNQTTKQRFSHTLYVIKIFSVSIDFISSTHQIFTYRSQDHPAFVHLRFSHEKQHRHRNKHFRQLMQLHPHIVYHAFKHEGNNFTALEPLWPL